MEKILKEKEENIYKLQQDLAGVEEECKELKIENIEIKKELNKIKKLKNIDITRYKEWNADEVVDWIISLRDGQFIKYEAQLRQAFVSEGVNGSSIDMIDKTELKNWGIQSFIDRGTLFKDLNALIHQNQNQQQQQQQAQQDVAPANNDNNDNNNIMAYNEGVGGTAFI